MTQVRIEKHVCEGLYGRRIGTVIRLRQTWACLMVEVQFKNKEKSWFMCTDLIPIKPDTDSPYEMAHHRQASS
jgi:hypothetical protein